jgi:hypothetical protein
MQMEVYLFRSFTNRIKSLITKSLPIISASETVSLVDLSNPTRVWAEASSIPNAHRPAFDKGTPDAAETAIHHDVKRFRRTMKEIRLGLSIQEAQASRSPKEAKGKSPKHGKRGGDKAKRFKRTQQEIKAGLSIEQAAALRNTAPPKAIIRQQLREGNNLANEAASKRDLKVHPRIAAQAPQARPDDLIETLSPKIQSRARAASRYRSSGGKGVVTTQMLDQIADAVAAGKVTKCPPFTDSDGFNHLTQQEAK